MQAARILLLVLVVGVVLAHAQQSTDAAASEDAGLTFTVASVKPLARLPGGGRAGGLKPLNEPGRLRFPAATLKTLFTLAWDVKDFQLVGPGWIDDERFTIDATMPPETTGDQTRAMLRNLLADRFKVQVHRETRSLPAYALVITKNGLKIPNTPPPTKEPGNVGLGPDGFPSIPPDVRGVLFFNMNGQAKMTAQQATMHELAAQLEKMLGAPVIDETQLTAKFDFALRFSPEGLNGPGGRPIPTATGIEAGEPLKDIFSALSEIGIKLEQKKGPVEMLVIDHAEKIPTDN
jgi:uncharacterized protein (TIGR03435 family)